LGGAGQGRLNIDNNFPPKKIRAKPKQADKKKKGREGNGFLPACSPRQSVPLHNYFPKNQGGEIKDGVNKLSKSAGR